jgi:hypothetical protein
MPLLGSGEYAEPFPIKDTASGTKTSPPRFQNQRRQSQHSAMAKTAIMSHFSTPSTDGARTPEEAEMLKDKETKTPSAQPLEGSVAAPSAGAKQRLANGAALTDTPLTTAPNSPIM